MPKLTMKRMVAGVFQPLAKTFGTLLLRHRSVIVTGLQGAIILVANLFAFVLRFEGQIPSSYRQRMVLGAPFVVVIYLLGLWAFGIHRGLWRYVGLHDLAKILWATTTATVVIFGLFHVGFGWSDYPRSVIILTGLLTAGFLAGIRLAVRWFREWLQIVGPTARRVLIVGAGNAAELLIRDMQANPSYNFKPVGLVDDEPVKQKAKIHGIPVLGRINDIGKAVERVGAQEIIVAIPSATPKLMQRVLAAAETCRIPFKTLPNIQQLLDSPVSMRQVRPLSLEDLLQREPIRTDLQELHPLLQGKKVLVTGAGGSIGSELCRQIAQYRPAQLMLFERHENSLYALDLELREAFPDIDILALIGDTTTADRVSEVFMSHAPHLIFHAAAHKHVPLMEHNPGEAVRNNIFGTRIVAEAALEAGVERFVLVSTDKAVNPTSVMGATKRIAESLVQDMSRQGRTKFTVVRFGNVLGSNGSVVPLFAEQIRKGGPVTVTHPEIKRFFMTIPEAVQLVLQASVIGQGGDLFVLDMGEQIRVADLAKNMILLSGHVPGQDLKIIFTGIRPGEKLYEELYDKGESLEVTSHEKIQRVLRHTPLEPNSFEGGIGDLELLLQSRNSEMIVCKLQEMVATYEPESTRTTK